MSLHTASKRHRVAGLCIAAGALLALGACASKGEAPVAQLATARASITQAEGAGAAQAAPLELQASRDKLTRAEAAVRDEKFVQAREFAEQSQADAELAERKSRAAKAETALNEVTRSNQQLGDEARRRAQP